MYTVAPGLITSTDSCSSTTLRTCSDRCPSGPPLVIDRRIMISWSSLLTQGLEFPPLRAAAGLLRRRRRPAARLELERLVIRRPRRGEPGGRLLRRRPEEGAGVVVREVRELAAVGSLGGVEPRPGVRELFLHAADARAHVFPGAGAGIAAVLPPRLLQHLG